MSRRIPNARGPCVCAHNCIILLSMHAENAVDAADLNTPCGDHRRKVECAPRFKQFPQIALTWFCFSYLIIQIAIDEFHM